ncbi:F0F1 ATP synthase subunit delta [Candidatus Curtissbacteria bacterium]|nr:F0F1 ATP synthase subunit delta [Candidatus Curtissbacteria bacterium]
MTKKQVRIAKVLFKKSLDQKRQISPHRVKRILENLERKKPQGILGILKSYRRLIESQLAKEEIEVEMAQKVMSKKIERLILSKTGAKRISFKMNPSMVLGAKITHGDWVWEETLEAKLKQITELT